MSKDPSLTSEDKPQQDTELERARLTRQYFVLTGGRYNTGALPMMISSCKQVMSDLEHYWVVNEKLKSFYRLATPLVDFLSVVLSLFTLLSGLYLFGWIIECVVFITGKTLLIDGMTAPMLWVGLGHSVYRLAVGVAVVVLPLLAHTVYKAPEFASRYVKALEEYQDLQRLEELGGPIERPPLPPPPPKKP